MNNNASRNRAASPFSPDEPAEAGGPGGPRALSRTLRIIERLAGVPEGSTLTQLSAALESPKSSLLGLLRPLCALGYVVNVNGRYTLGPAAYRLGVSIMPTLSMARIAQPILRQLADQFEETVLIATLDRDAARAIYIDKVESSHSIRYTVPLGTARPLYCSAAGRVLLAHADTAFVEHYLRTAAFEPLTLRTVTSPSEVRDLLPKIREQGLAMTVGEVSADVAGFAAPIFDHRGVVIAALAMAALVSRVQTYAPTAAKLVQDAAESISFGFGYPKAEWKVSLPEPAPSDLPPGPRPSGPTGRPRRRGTAES
ncbi:MAG: IclR family transcriptional regulator [Alphaproteobacteria bacterium]|nr:IclR family transcriptional regulator [Alphaproteobacteria bacterium]